LPEGIQVNGDEIPARSDKTLLTLTLKEGAKPAQVVLPQVIGVSTDPRIALRRIALTPETPLTKPMPWLRQELAIAATEASPLGITRDTLDARFPIGGKATGKLKLTRTPEVKGNIRVTLLTNQTVPKGPDGRTENVNRALRLEAVPTIPPNQMSAELKIVVPP